MTTATIPLDDVVADLRQAMARQDRRLEALEAALFEAAPPTVLLKDLPKVVDPAADTKPAAQLETPNEIRWPPKREAPAAPEADAPRPAGTALDPLAVLASLDDVVWSVSPDGQFVFLLAGAVERTYGEPASHLQDTPGAWLDAVPEPDRAELAAVLRRLPDVERFEIEHRIETAAGTTRWVVSRGRLVRDWAGKPLRVDGITVDVTSQTRPARLLADVLERTGPATGDEFLTTVVEHLAGGFDARTAAVVVPDADDPARCRTVALWLDGRLAPPLFAPAAGPFVADALAGLPKVLPNAARDRFPADEFLAALRAECAVAESLVDARGTLLGFVVVLDDRARSDAADVRAVLRAVAPRIVAELGRPREPTARVAELEARLADAESQLRAARGLETVGRIVTGVAHDFNNLLTVISGNAEAVRELLPANDPVREPADLIAATASTAAGVARQLVAFGKPHTGEPGPLDANAAIRSMERLLRRVVGDRVEFDLVLSPALPAATADPGQFDQVLLNLVANARDAIADAGVITVRTAVAAVGPDRPGWPDDVPAGVFVAVTVSDTGVGMTPEVKARVFNPYFTTKGEAGHGIGLATVRDIVRAAGGHVEVESSPEWGTSVRVYWPKTDATAVIRAPMPRVPAAAGGETVLVVQDGDRLRDVTVMALQQAGYRVLEAADGETGEERALFYAGPIHLLVADVGLPKLGGVELVARVRTERPGVKVLFVSGAPPPDGHGAAFLAKPYSPADLLAAARAVLDTGE